MIGHVWQGTHATPSTGAAVIVQATTAGSVVAVLNGRRSAPLALDPAVGFGVGRIDFDGLSPGSSYNVQVEHSGGALARYRVTTIPANRIKLVWLSCFSQGAGLSCGALIRDRVQPDLLISQGDMPYSGDSTKKSWGNPALVPTEQAPLNAQNYHYAFEQAWKAPGWIDAITARPVLYMPDDHEQPGGNWDHTIAQAEHGNPVSVGLGHTPSQTEVNDVWRTASTAQRVWMLTNAPAPAGAGQLPAAASTGGATPDVADYPRRYCTIANDVARVWLPDCLSHRSPVSATDDASKQMLGTAQESWLVDGIAAAAEPIQLIASNKPFFSPAHVPAADDRWVAYASRRDYLLQAAHDTGKTVVGLTGDKHWPHVDERRTDAGAPYDFLSVNACPVGVSFSPHAWGLGAYTRWMHRGVGDQYRGNCFGVAEVPDGGDRVILRVVDAATGLDMWSAQVAAGSRARTVRRVRA